MEKDEKFMKEVMATVKKAQTSFHIFAKAMQENKEQLRKICDDLSSSYDNFTRDVLEDVETLEKVIKLATQGGNYSEAYCLLESLQACFDPPANQQWVDVTMNAKRRLLNEAQQISNDYLEIKREAVLKIRKIFSEFLLVRSEKRESRSISLGPKLGDTFFGIVSAIINPGEFYVVRLHNTRERKHFFERIQNTAPIFPPIDAVIPGQMYAVRSSSDQHWFRAIAGVYFGFFQVGDDPAETLYQCFLVDIGSHERISKSSIRMLPDDLKKRPPYAIKCTLGADFKRKTWSLQSIASFKDWALPRPIEIQVLAKEEDRLHVDLFRLEEGNRVSVTDSLLKVYRPPPPPTVATEKAAPIKQFKPKFGDMGSNSSLLIKYSSVIITKAASPKDIYVQLLDEDYPLYCQMKDELQKEFHSATSQSTSFCSSPVAGNPYAAQYGTEWHRVFIDTSGGKTEVFYVDLGHRQGIQSTMMFHYLPDRFMELPTQSVWCTLHGVTPPGRNILPNYPKAIYEFFRCYEGKTAVAFFEHWIESKILNPALKLRAYVVLYPTDGNDRSINIQVTETPMACLRFGYRYEQIELPEHRNIRKRLAARSSARLLSKIEHVVPSVIDSEKRQAPEAVIGIHHANTEAEVIPIPVTFIGCRSPQSIFFRTPELEIGFLSLQKAMSAHFEAHKESSTEDEPIHLKVGFVCAVKSQGIWYRAKVIDMAKYPEIAVCLVDKTCFMKVHANRIRHLPEEMKRAHKMVLRCSLSRVFPSSGIEWNPKVTRHVRDRLHKAEKIIIECRKDKLTGSDSDAGEAIQVSVFTYESSSSQVTGSMTTITNLNQELVSLRLASKYANTLGVPRRLKCPKLWKSREDFFKVGDTFFATATHFSQKGEIFLQDVRFQSELDIIRIHLNEKYDGTSPKETDLLCAPGNLCIARFESNWFRGVVLEVSEKMVTVYCVDYGYSKIVDLTDIRLDVALVEKPVQVLRCSLHNLKPPGNAVEWSTEDQRTILFEATKCEFRVSIMKPGSPHQVAMVYKNVPQSFNREMVERKLAGLITTTKIMNPYQ